MLNNTIRRSFWFLLAVTSYSSSPSAVREIIPFYQLKVKRQKTKHVYLCICVEINITYVIKFNQENNVKIKFIVQKLNMCHLENQSLSTVSYFYPFTTFYSRNPTAIFRLKCSNMLLSEATAALSETSH